MSEYEPWQEAAMEYAESVAENIRKIFSIINEEESSMSNYDPVNKPEHYTNTKVECIDAMEEVFGKETLLFQT